MSFYLILGMHRSGTSCLTGALERCGLYLGEVRRKGKHNKKGYFEKEIIAKVHDQILGLNKSSWFSPPAHSLNIKVHSHHRAQLIEIVEKLKINQPCGLKDPRTILLLEFWKNMMAEKSLGLIGTFRHPLAVAESLNKRNNMPIEEGIRLWVDYNTRLVEEHQNSHFPLINYDLANPKVYRQQILTLAKQLNLIPNKLKLRLFISARLEHHSSNILSIPDSCKILFNYLTEHQIKVNNSR